MCGIVNRPEGTLENPTSRQRRDVTLPPYATHLHGWFMWYVRGYLRRHFHAIRLLKPSDGRPTVPDVADQPVLLYTNHPSWWDPLIFLSVAQKLFPDRLNYGPIDSTALGRYSFLEKIGFIGIEPDSWKGAARFLRLARAALERPDVFFWVTAQGNFVDPRHRPVTIKPGVGHAAAVAKRGLIIPFALEYPFWNERLPEAIVSFGTPHRIDQHTERDADTWNRILEKSLEETQDELRDAAIARNSDAFTELASGTVGVGGAYDIIRRIRSTLSGKTFNPAHEEESS